MIDFEFHEIQKETLKKLERKSQNGRAFAENLAIRRVKCDFMDFEHIEIITAFGKLAFEFRPNETAEIDES